MQCNPAPPAPLPAPIISDPLMLIWCALLCVALLPVAVLSCFSSPCSPSAPPPPLFACPQQPTLLLPPSRIHDGICDCCDGKDEPPSARCPDICDRVLKKEREARAKREASFRAGSQRREADLAEFARKRESTLRGLEGMEAQATAASEEVEAVERQIRTLKREYANARMSTMRDAVAGSPDMVELLNGLEREEMQHLIVHACQVAGEILTSEKESDTCVALRMAGLDLALTWDDDDYDNADKMKGKVEVDKESGKAEVSWDLVQLLFENASNGGSLNWMQNSRGGKATRRRLDEVDDIDDVDYDYMASVDEDYDGAFAGDEIDKNDELHGDDQKDDLVEGKEKEFIDEVKASHFSKTRSSFLARSKDVLEAIAGILDVPLQEDGEDTETEEGAKGETAKDNSGAKIDPATYTMVRHALRSREDAIRRGFRWAASAKLLFAFSNHSDENLRRLVVGTLYYGQLSAVQVWQIFQSILPEYATVRSETPIIDTCASPWASSCPPKPIHRKGANYPPSYILAAADVFCEQQASSGHIQEACAAQAEESITIPSSIPDGYYGYTSPVKRSDIKGDPLSAIFAPMDNIPLDTVEVDALETRKKDLERSKKDTERSINDTWKDIGGKDGAQMGQDGELHAMANKCYDILAGRYTYEVCIFGGATQKEGDGSGGTNLGQWKGMDIHESTGRRVMKWANGQKCWNGPSRSATVYLTCGAENKLTSATEPDTCRYVFEMESYIACDGDYRVRAGL